MSDPDWNSRQSGEVDIEDVRRRWAGVTAGPWGWVRNAGRVELRGAVRVGARGRGGLVLECASRMRHEDAEALRYAPEDIATLFDWIDGTAVLHATLVEDLRRARARVAELEARYAR